MRPDDDPGWADYARTVLVIHGDAATEVDLARPIGARERAAFRAVGLAGAFGLVTPDNPRGLPAAAEENVRRRERFLAGLAARGCTPVRVDGLSPDRAHREVGVALPWPCEEVRALARAWEQSAIYWFDGVDMWVIGALTAAPPWRLGPG